MVHAQTPLHEHPMSARSEIISANYREPEKSKSPRVSMRHSRPVRSASQRASASCAHCKLPLLIDIQPREIDNVSRASSTLSRDSLCKECSQDKRKNGRSSSSSRLFKSASANWSNMGDSIETWFEKARTPDQRAVYNFLEQINGVPVKATKKSDEPAGEKSLDDILHNLKKYRTRFHSSRPPNKLTRGFESSSWRVMRQPPPSPYHFSPYNAAFGDEASRDIHIGSVFGTTGRRIGSTFLLHPDWI